jgi:hypothetical protein
MSKDAILPCIKCGMTLGNSFEDSINQPSEGTEFTTYGHYGSTFWDSFSGEQIIINVCDACLRENTARIARRKAFRKVVVWDTRGAIHATTVVGRAWVWHEMVPYFEGPEDDDEIGIEVQEIGVLTGYKIEWVDNWRDIKADLASEQRAEDGLPGGCKHIRFVAECTDCGARPLEGLR